MPFYASERTRIKADGHRKLRVYQQWQGNEVGSLGVGDTVVVDAGRLSEHALPLLPTAAMRVAACRASAWR